VILTVPSNALAGAIVNAPVLVLNIEKSLLALNALEVTPPKPTVNVPAVLPVIVILML
jgi:hypothetical protein